VEQPDALTFRDRCARSFVRYEGAWRLSEHNGQTAITYELAAEPSFDIPGWMLKRLLRRDSAEMIDRLQREIAARSTRNTDVTSTRWRAEPSAFAATPLRRDILRWLAEP